MKFKKVDDKIEITRETKELLERKQLDLMKVDAEARLKEINDMITELNK